MNLDLTSIFGRAQSLAEQAMTSSGTRVRGQRGQDAVTVDPDTLQQVVVPAPLTVADTVALLVPQSGGAGGQQYPGTPRAETTWRLILPVAVTDVLVGDIFTVLACRDPRLATDAQFKISAIPDSSAGAIRDLSVLAVASLTPGAADGGSLGAGGNPSSIDGGDFTTGGTTGNYDGGSL